MVESYRNAGVVRPSPPQRLECRLAEGDKGWLRNVFVKLLITSTFCRLLWSWNAELALIPAAIFAALWIGRDLRRRGGALVSFTVTMGCVHVERPDGALDFTLEDLEDVALDTKAARKTVAGTDSIHRPLGIATTGSLAVDVSRMELLLSRERSIVLDEEWISHSLCTEQLRTIRLFLRKHGWKPLDERDAA